MYELINIFDSFLPQLLQDPNPKDPLNGEAARLLLKDPEDYKKKIREYIKAFASENLMLSKNQEKEVQNNQAKKEGPTTNEGKAKADNVSQTSELSNASDKYESDG